MKNVACFITAGWTEAGEMQGFLGKIRSDCKFFQCFPHKPKVRRGENGKLYKEEITGETGEALLEKVLRILKEYPDYNNKYDAILIEDDLDQRLKNKTDDDIKEHYADVTAKVVTAYGRKIPVIIMYASPEIESWFISDWENCFEGTYASKVYVPDLTSNERLLFLNRLNVAINRKINTNNIEHFGYDQEKYLKLSDQLQELFTPDSIRDCIMLDCSDSPHCQKICESKYLYYSKRIHGSVMLRNADPETIQRKCTYFFKNGYNELREL